MSPYTLFPGFSFLERVYKDGIRIIVYKASNNIPEDLDKNLFPYDAIFEEDSYVKNCTEQNYPNYVYFYDKKYLNDPEYVSRRNDTIRENSVPINCTVYEFNIDAIKMKLLEVNEFDIKKLRGTLDDLWVGLFFDREMNDVKYELCKEAPNGMIVKAPKSIYTTADDRSYMYYTNKKKMVVNLDFVTCFEYSKYGNDPMEYMELKKGISRLSLRRENNDWISDSKEELCGLIKYGLPLEFAYKASMVDNMVFIVEDMFRSYRDKSLFGPLYRNYDD